MIEGIDQGDSLVEILLCELILRGYGMIDLADTLQEGCAAHVNRLVELVFMLGSRGHGQKAGKKNCTEALSRHRRNPPHQSPNGDSLQRRSVVRPEWRLARWSTPQDF